MDVSNSLGWLVPAAFLVGMLACIGLAALMMSGRSDDAPAEPLDARRLAGMLGPLEVDTLVDGTR